MDIEEKGKVVLEQMDKYQVSGIKFCAEDLSRESIIETLFVALDEKRMEATRAAIASFQQR